MNNGANRHHKKFMVTVDGGRGEPPREYEFLTHATARDFWLKLHQAGQTARFYKLDYKRGKSEPRKISLEY